MAAIDEWPVQAGDGPFEAFYLTHKPAVYLTALRHLNNRDDAEEITQETFLSAYRALARGTQPTAPRAWLLTIARNACRAHFRKSTRYRREVPLGNEIESASTDAGILDTWEVRTALEGLPAKQRGVLVLREVLGLSFPEIADRLGQSEPSVQALCFRARETMREELEAARSPLSCDKARELVASGCASTRGPERDVLRAHLRRCRGCAVEARRRRARRTALGILTGPFHRLVDWLGLASGFAPSAKLGVVLGAATIAAGIAGQPGSAPAGSDALVERIASSRPAAAAHALVDPRLARPELTGSSRPDGYPGGSPPRDRRDWPEREQPDSADGTPNVQLPISTPPQASDSNVGPGDTTPPDEGHQSASQPAGHPDSRPTISTSPVAQATAEHLVEPVTEAATELIPDLPEVTLPELNVPLPESDAPEVTAPGLDLPEVTVPDLDLPEVP